jgi:hypothetical protein
MIARPIVVIVQQVTVRLHVAARAKTSVALPSCRGIPVIAMVAHVMVAAHNVPMLAGRMTVHLMAHRAVQAALHAVRNHAVMADVRQVTPVTRVGLSVRTAIAKVQVASAWMASSAASVMMATVPAAARPSDLT